MLEVKNFSFSYEGGDKLWKPINLLFKEGQVVAIKGKNGSGKTTLLNCLCGIIPAYTGGKQEGEILFRGKPISSNPLKRTATEINILFQDPDKQIFMPTVEEEIAFGIENLCLEREQIIVSVSLVMKKLKIEHLRYSKTASLSFGQKKMVVLAALLVMSPKVILVDEFCAGMEDSSISLFAEYVLEMKKEGKLVILADHHNTFAGPADLVVNLDRYLLGNLRDFGNEE